MTEHNGQAPIRQEPGQALYALVAAMRDNILLEQWALDELLDMQPTNEHAKALLCALEIHGFIAPDECEIAMLDRDLGAA